MAAIAISHHSSARIRQPLTIKPSIRQRQSPDPYSKPAQRKSITFLPKPVDFDPNPTNNDNLSNILPPNVFLHPDDANSRVFIAIARSLMSVDNKAMTIKDLSEMCVQNGLICQNVSAASQAITTYIRNHLQRCDAQQDQPLLMRHILSGTPLDDALLPGLHSLSGGSHLPALKEKDTSPSAEATHRATNFRKGTMVWYLSRACGAPCPFTRAGVRLCTYTEHEDDSGNLERRKKKERKRERGSQRLAAKMESGSHRQEQQCGEKRKRKPSLPKLRPEEHCSDDSSQYDSDMSSEDDKPPPPKVKLTLRLKPLHKITGSTESPVVSTFPPISSTSEHPGASTSWISAAEQPVRSLQQHLDSDINMSDALDDESDSDTNENTQNARPTIIIPPLKRLTSDEYRRSPSVPFSIRSGASPPPDSDDDEQLDTCLSPRSECMLTNWDDEMDTLNFESSSEIDDDEWSIDGSSPGPRSPSAPLLLPHLYQHKFIDMKDEPQNVQGMLDAWDDLDHMHELYDILGYGKQRMAEVLGQAASHVLGDTSLESLPPNLKMEDSGSYSWDWTRESSEPQDTSPFSARSSPLDSSPAPSVSSHRIKQEEEECEDTVSALTFQQWRSSQDLNGFSSSPLLSPVSPSVLSDNGLFYPFGFPFNDLDSPMMSRGGHGFSSRPSTTSEIDFNRPRSRTVPNPNQWTGGSSPTDSLSDQPIAQSLSSLIQSLRLSMAPNSASKKPEEYPAYWLVDEPPMACVSPKDMDIRMWQGMQTILPTFTDVSATEVVAGGGDICDKDAAVVQMCKPCNPEIWATQVEGIPVYQSSLGSQTLLRRIDTNFVNLTAILKHSQSPIPVLSTISNAFMITRGSEVIQGMWVPLESAQMYVKDHPVPGTANVKEGLDTFLSVSLAEKFPSALRGVLHNVHNREGDGGIAGVFGKVFGSMLKARDVIDSADGNQSYLPSQNSPSMISDPEPAPVVQDPLSPGEQEILQALCVNLEWEKDEEIGERVHITPETSFDITPSKDLTSPVEVPVSPPHRSAPQLLRRSKRVADAAAAQTRPVKSRKRGSRNLS